MFQIKWSCHQIVLTNCLNFSVNKGGSVGKRGHEVQIIRLPNSLIDSWNKLFSFFSKRKTVIQCSFNWFLKSFRLQNQFFISIDQITKYFLINYLTFSVKEEALLVDMDAEDQILSKLQCLYWYPCYWYHR